MDTSPVQIRQTNFRNGLCLASGTIGVLACVVMLGWFIRSVPLTQVMPSFAPMQFNTALMFLCASISSILAIRGNVRGALIACAVLVGFSSLTVSQYPLKASFGIDTFFVEPFTTTRTSHPGRMAPNTAVAFIFTGMGIAGFALYSRCKALPVIGSTIALCLGLLALYGYLAAAENAYGWGDFTRMALHTATGFVILNATLLLEAWRKSRPPAPPRPLPQWLTFVAAMLSLTVGLCAWNSILILEEKRSDREMRTLAYLVNEKVTIALQGDLKAMVRMADRYEGGVRDRSWIDDSVNYLTDIPGLFAIAYFEEGSQSPRIVVLDQSREPEAAQYQNLPALKRIRERASIFHDKDWRDDGFLMSIRIREPDTQAIAGYLVGFFDTEPFIQHAIKNEKHRNRVRISMDGVPIFSGEAFFNGTGNSNAFARADDPDHPWSVTVAGSNDLSITEVGLRLSTITLFGTLLLAGLISWITKLGVDTYNLQLLQTDQEVRDAYGELETLLFVISHDLKEPVRSINSFASLLEEDLGDSVSEEDRRMLQRVVGGAERLEDILSDVSTISRAYRMDAPSESVPLSGIVKDQIEALNNELLATDAKVTVADDLPTITVEKIWTGRAVNNLLTNALKFTPPGHPAEITIEAYEGPEGRGIVVKDRGIGLPEKADDRLFDLFKRGVGKAVEGTGVGLAIVKKVAQNHGGKAWFKHRPGGGAEFYLTLSPARKKTGHSAKTRIT